jgi:hypothetical protein
MQQPEMIRLMDQTRIRVPGAIDAAILIELFALMKEFFIETNIWRDELTFTAQPASVAGEGPATYDVVPTKGTIVRLLSVTDPQGHTVRAVMDTPGCIMVLTPPAAPETYTAHVVLTVSDPTTRDDYPQFPVWVLNRYHTGILDGLIGRMLSQIAKPYSSPALAMAHLRSFRKTMSMARVDTRTRNVYGAQTWRFPRGFAR